MEQVLLMNINNNSSQLTGIDKLAGEITSIATVTLDNKHQSSS